MKPKRNHILECNLSQYQLFGNVSRGGRYVRTPDGETFDPSADPGTLNAIDTYLSQLPNESDTSFSLRKARAAFRNYCQEITRVYAATLFAAGNQVDRSAVVSILGDSIAQNIDLRGSSIDTFLRHGFKESLTAGWALCLSDLPRVREGEINSLADEMYLRPYSRWIVAANVWNWRRDPITGELTYLLIDEGFHPWYEGKNVWSVWTRETWEIIDKEGTHLDGGIHNLGMVPADILICDEPSDDSDTEPFGHSALRDVADLQLEVYRTSSELEDLLRKTAFPFLHGETDAGNPDIKPTTQGNLPLGPDYAIFAPFAISWVSPDEKAATVLANHIAELGREIRQIAGIAARSEESTEAHSGAALQWEYSTKLSLVKLRAENLRDFECRLWKRYQSLLKKDLPWSSVKYPSDYASAQSNDEIEELKVMTEIDAPIEVRREYMRSLVMRRYYHKANLPDILATVDTWGEVSEPTPADDTSVETPAEETIPAEETAPVSASEQIDMDSISKQLNIAQQLIQNKAPQELIRAIVIDATQKLGISDPSIVAAINANVFRFYTERAQAMDLAADTPEAKEEAVALLKETSGE